MLKSPKSLAAAALLTVFLVGYLPKAFAQATATVVGRVQDAQGAVVANAPVTLTSETRGTTFKTTSASSGDFIFPNVPGDSYKVEASMTGFNTVVRTGIQAVPGGTVAVPPITLEIGNVTQTIEVSAEAPLVQTATGERSSVVEQETLQNIPVTGTFFAQLVALTPGVNSTSSNGPTRSDNTGNVARTNYMLDGVSSVNTGGNQPGISLNTDSVAEVKVLTNSYGAEYGRSSGLQVIGVTKSGTDHYHGSFYDIDQHSGWNANSWANRGNGVARPYSHTQYLGRRRSADPSASLTIPDTSCSGSSPSRYSRLRMAAGSTSSACPRRSKGRVTSRGVPTITGICSIQLPTRPKVCPAPRPTRPAASAADLRWA